MHKIINNIYTKFKISRSNRLLINDIKEIIPAIQNVNKTERHCSFYLTEYDTLPTIIEIDTKLGKNLTTVQNPDYVLKEIYQNE